MSLQSNALRQRAHRLRRYAEQIEHTPAMSLERHATVDTWRGPRPEECLRLLHSAQHRIHEAADDLRLRAWLLDQHADELDAAAAAAVLS